MTNRRPRVDPARKTKLMRALLDNLDKHGRPGGVDVSRQDAESAVALQELLKKRPDLTVVKNKTRLTLMYRADVDLTFSPEVATAMARHRVTAFAGEELYDAGPDDAK